jgi:hypothetical protein
MNSLAVTAARLRDCLFLIVLFALALIVLSPFKKTETVPIPVFHPPFFLIIWTNYYLRFIALLAAVMCTI